MWNRYILPHTIVTLTYIQVVRRRRDGNYKTLTLESHLDQGSLVEFTLQERRKANSLLHWRFAHSLYPFLLLILHSSLTPLHSLSHLILYWFRFYLKLSCKKQELNINCEEKIEIQSHLRYASLSLYSVSSPLPPLSLLIPFADIQTSYACMDTSMIKAACTLSWSSPRAVSFFHQLQKCRRFDEHTAATYILSLADALKYCHSKTRHSQGYQARELADWYAERRLARGDSIEGNNEIKHIANVCSGLRGELKIADFGWSVHAPHSRRQTMYDTLPLLPFYLCLPPSSAPLPSPCSISLSPPPLPPSPSSPSPSPLSPPLTLPPLPLSPLSPLSPPLTEIY